MYCRPRIEDFGTIERQVHNLTSPPNGEEPGNGMPTGGGDGGAIGILGIAAGIAAVVSKQGSTPVEPTVGPDDDEEGAQKFD